MSILSKAKSVAKKAVSAAKSFGSNVAGGAKIVAGAVKAGVQRVAAIPSKGGLLNSTSKSMDFPTLPGASYSNSSTGNQQLNRDSGGNYYVTSKSPTVVGPKTSSGSLYSGSSSSSSSLSRSGPVTVAPASTYSNPSGTTAAATTVVPVNNLGVTAPTLPSAPSAGLSLPTAASNLVNVGTMDAGGTPIVTDPGTTQEPDKYQKMIEQSLAGMMGNQPERTDYGRADALESSGYNKALKEANDLSNQISAINADTESKKLSLIGQGRGIPEAIIGGQQAKLDREAAIKTMPLTAQYKAAVGLVDAAKEIVNNFVADERAYQQSLQQWQNNVYNATYQYATAQQKIQLDQQKALTDRQYEVEDRFLDQQADLFKVALENGKGYLGSRIYKARNIDELTAIGNEMGVPIDTLYKQAQINKMNYDMSGAGTGGTVTLDNKPQNASQAAANGYADRLNESNIVIDSIGGKFTGNLAFGGSLPNALQSGERQSYEQAKRNFITAVLRRESGAAISPSEFDTEALKYFPQAGDKPETVIQKSNARNTAINNVYREANVARPVLPGMIIESDGKKYRVSSDGETLEQI